MQLFLDPPKKKKLRSHLMQAKWNSQNAESTETAQAHTSFLFPESNLEYSGVVKMEWNKRMEYILMSLPEYNLILNMFYSCLIGLLTCV